jgi:hypothetical protein
MGIRAIPAISLPSTLDTPAGQLSAAQAASRWLG